MVRVYVSLSYPFQCGYFLSGLCVHLAHVCTSGSCVGGKGKTDERDQNISIILFFKAHFWKRE